MERSWEKDKYLIFYIPLFVMILFGLATLFISIDCLIKDYYIPEVRIIEILKDKTN